MLCKVPPNHDCSVSQILRRVIQNDIRYQLPREVSAEGQKFAKKLLEFDQHKRPSAAEALIFDYMKRIGYE